MSLIWRGKKISSRIRTRAWRDVQAATLIVEAAVKTSMKAGGTTESGEVAFGAYSLKTRKGLKSTAYDPKTGKKGVSKVGAFTSKPGEVPRVQTGRLKGSITTWMDPTLPIGRVGTNLPYGRPLELGYPPGNLAPRPFMRPALHKSEAAIKAKFSEPMVGD